MLGSIGAAGWSTVAAVADRGGEIHFAAAALIAEYEALEAFHRLTRTEGIIPALETSHAIAHAIKIAPDMNRDQSILINLSGRGDKDMHTVAAQQGLKL